MSNYKQKNKGIRFMFFLILFGFVIVYFSKNFDKDKNIFASRNTLVEKQAEECSTCGNNNEEQIVQEEDNYQIYYLDVSETVDVSDYYKGGQVLGLTSIGCDNLSPTNTLESVKRLCTQSSDQIDHGNYSDIIDSSGSGVRIGKDTSFELTLVTYPLAFWLGQYVLENSNREIKETSPEYSSNGQQIDLNYQAKTLSPQESAQLEAEVTGTIRKEFEVKAILDVPGSDRVNEQDEGEYIVANADHDPKCMCPDEVSTSDYNVGMSNYIASNKDNGGYYRQQIPGGDNYQNNEGEACLQAGKDFETITKGVVVSCIDVVGLLDGFFSAVFSTGKWEKCTVGEEVCEYNSSTGQTECRRLEKEDCLDTKNIGIKMTPIFGDPYECTNELCANAFLTYSYKGSLSPTQSSTKQVSSSSNEDSLMFYIATDCKAKFDINGKGQTVDVKCLWDASPTLTNYKLQAKDKAPNQENFPDTFESYWESVKIAMGLSADYYGL